MMDVSAGKTCIWERISRDRKDQREESAVEKNQNPIINEGGFLRDGTDGTGEEVDSNGVMPSCRVVFSGTSDEGGWLGEKSSPLTGLFQTLAQAEQRTVQRYSGNTPHEELCSSNGIVMASAVL